MSKSTEKEPVTSVEREPNEPEKSAAEKKERTNMILVVLLAAGVGIEAYFFILKTRWEKKMPSALDEFVPDDKK